MAHFAHRDTLVGGERARTREREKERGTHHTPVCSYSLRRILRAMIPQQRVIASRDTVFLKRALLSSFPLLINNVHYPCISPFLNRPSCNKHPVRVNYLGVPVRKIDCLKEKKFFISKKKKYLNLSNRIIIEYRRSDCPLKPYSSLQYLFICASLI